MTTHHSDRPSVSLPKSAYPTTAKTNQADTYHGVRVEDPYRWLEDDNAADTRAWVEAQNKVTFGYLEQIPERHTLRDRLTKLWNFERYKDRMCSGLFCERSYRFSRRVNSKPGSLICAYNTHAFRGAQKKPVPAAFANSKLVSLDVRLESF